MASSNQFLGREEYKKKKELEEARKAGTAAPEQDEEGNEINPHIPQYIAQAPWYLHKDIANQAPSLKHQRLRSGATLSSSSTVQDRGGWYLRGVKGPTATKYRKGACTNCGAMTHRAKDCTDRPRKIGAKYTGKHIASDELVQDVELDFEGKRDRWNGYDPAIYSRVVEKYDKLSEERRKTHSEQQQQEEDNAEKLEQSEQTMVGQHLDTTSRTSIRNLRIREDTAKYLLNLDVNSAYYDPKTRSMRENPLPSSEDTMFKGDNFVRYTGDTQKFNEIQMFSWEAEGRGQDLHVLAAPSQAELLHSEFKRKKEQLKEQQRQAIVHRYGTQSTPAIEKPSG